MGLLSRAGGMGPLTDQEMRLMMAQRPPAPVPQPSQSPPPPQYAPYTPYGGGMGAVSEQEMQQFMRQAPPPAPPQGYGPLSQRDYEMLMRGRR